MAVKKTSKTSEASEPTVAAPKQKKSGFVTVVANKGDMYEPFQVIHIPQGLPTPVRDTDWVKSQIAAGLLTEE